MFCTQEGETSSSHDTRLTDSTRKTWTNYEKNTDDNKPYTTENNDDNNETTLETYKTNWKTNTITNCNS